MKLDEQGWSEMSTTLAAAFGEVEQIRGDAERRLADNGEDGIPSTCGDPRIPVAGRVAADTAADRRVAGRLLSARVNGDARTTERLMLRPPGPRGRARLPGAADAPDDRRVAAPAAAAAVPARRRGRLAGRGRRPLGALRVRAVGGDRAGDRRLPRPGRAALDRVSATAPGSRCSGRSTPTATTRASRARPRRRRSTSAPSWSSTTIVAMILPINVASQRVADEDRDGPRRRRGRARRLRPPPVPRRPDRPLMAASGGARLAPMRSLAPKLPIASIAESASTVVHEAQHPKHR